MISASQAGSLVKEFGGSKVLLHFGGGSVVKSGLLDRVKNSLKDAGISFVELGGVQPNPRDDKVYEGIELCKKEGVDFILAVGGGSAIDSAKAIAMGVCYDGDFWDFYSGKAQYRPNKKEDIFLSFDRNINKGEEKKTRRGLGFVSRYYRRYRM